MTKRPRPEFSIKILLNNLKLINKEEVELLFNKCLSKDDLLKSLEFIYSQANFTTNDKIEKYFYNKIAKSSNIEN